MVRIRLSRTGRKNLPSYKIVITPQREKRESRALEYIGHYSPITKVLEIKEERAKYWLSVGAQPSETVKSLLIRKGVIAATKKEKFNKKPGKQSAERKSKEEAKASAPKVEEPKAEEVVEEVKAEVEEAKAAE